MVGKSKAATPKEKRRMELIRGLGCVACVLKNWPDVQCEVHHVIDGYRVGHGATMGLCLWHHRGHMSDGYESYTRQQMMGMLGPSLAHGSNNFTEDFGEQATLLRVQDYIIDRFESEPWLEFSMPRGVVLDIFYFWSDLRRQNETP